MPHYTVHVDTETADRAGAGGTFQVTHLEDEQGVDQTHLITDRGKHYPEDDDFSTLRADIAKATGHPIGEITVDQG